MTEQNTERVQAFKQLRLSLRALAMAGDEQRMLFADLAASAGDLASNYDQSAAVIRADYEPDLSTAQSEACDHVSRWR